MAYCGNNMSTGTDRGNKQILTTLLLERKVPVDYRLLIEKVGGPLGIDPNTNAEPSSNGAMVLPAMSEGL